MGPDNFGGGASQNDDRFAAHLGQYRAGGRRDSGRTIAGEVAADLAGRNGASALDPRNGASAMDSRNGAGPLESRNGASAMDSRNGGPLDSRNGAGPLVSRNAAGALDSRSGSGSIDATAPIASSITPPRLVDPAACEPAPLTEPGHAAELWRDPSAGSLADHPLLRGLLMELPPKGTVPPAEYLDRWFEAARSILDLLYTMNART